MGIKPSAEPFLPERFSLKNLTAAAKGCQGCDLYKHALQTVFGEGPSNATVVLIGEQPGDQEDRQGHPFVGPAGKLLDRALEHAGIERSEVYLTNAVKHFRFEDRGGAPIT
jgi:uracil-DNA glycosylase family 4